MFIAGPVLTLWKEREPVYHARAERIRQQFGGVVPAYAVATAGAPVDVAPKETKRSREAHRAGRPVARRVGPGVRGDGARPRDRGGEQQRQPAAARAGNRPAGGRRARSRAEQQADQPPQDGGDDKPKKPRNRRHGRPR